jgi:threonine dehydratase
MPPVLESLARMIGNTPLFAIDFLYHGRQRSIYAKCEYLSLTGSIKDRMALHILRWKRPAAIPASLSPLWAAHSATRSRSSCRIG